MEIKTALISVSNKEGIIELAKFLQEKNVKIISSGGTYALLKENGVNAIKASDITGFPEILDGRVKTLHPNIHGGILADSNNENHLVQLKKHGIQKIDLVIVNLYPFEDTVNETKDETKIIENIDVGGPAMIRAAAKNFGSTAVLSAPNQYEEFIKNFDNLDLEKRKTLAFKAFSRTARYDSLIADYLNKTLDTDKEKNKFPNNLTISGVKVRNLRYGENPHQRASLYAFSRFQKNSIITAEKLHGKDLSFNNLVDADAAWELVSCFNTSAQKNVCAIIKHANPCGVAISSSAIDALEKAIRCDEQSSFGGVFAFNCEVTTQVAQSLSKKFLEIIIAPSFSIEGLAILQKKKNLILLKAPLKQTLENDFVFKNINGGFILQDTDVKQVTKQDLILSTLAKPSENEYTDLLFAFKVIKYVHSNAIVIAKNGATIGIGAGQMSRVDAVKIAIQKATSIGFDLKGAVLASDAFFPFPDSINYISDYGISSVIQPGGSIRDTEVIEACNNFGISMVFSGVRSFRH